MAFIRQLLRKGTLLGAVCIAIAFASFHALWEPNTDTQNQSLANLRPTIRCNGKAYRFEVLYKIPISRILANDFSQAAAFGSEVPRTDLKSDPNVFFILDLTPKDFKFRFEISGAAELSAEKQQPTLWNNDGLHEMPHKIRGNRRYLGKRRQADPFSIENAAILDCRVELEYCVVQISDRWSVKGLSEVGLSFDLPQIGMPSWNHIADLLVEHFRSHCDA